MTPVQLDLITAMRTIVAVAATGSATEAARELGTTQSNVSRRLAALAGAYGADVATGTGRAFRLTDAGHAVARHGRVILQSHDLILRDVAAAARDAEAAWRGRVTVACTEALLRSRLMPAVRALIARHPDLALDLVPAGAPCDVALEVGEEEAAVAGAVGAVAPTTVAAPTYLAATSAVPLRPGDLAAHWAIAVRGGADAAAVTWAYVEDGREVAVAPACCLGLPTLDLALQAAICGQGIARLPGYLVYDQVAVGGLVPLLEAYEPPPRPLFVVVGAPAPVPAVVSSVARALRAVVRRDPALAPVRSSGASPAQA